MKDWSANRERFLRRRALCLKLERPVFAGIESPTCLAIDEWTNQLMLHCASHELVLSNLDTEARQSTALRTSMIDARWYPFDSGLFVTCNSEKVFLWDSSSLTVVKSYEIGSRCNQLALSSVPSSSAGIIALASGHGQIRLINLLTGAATHTLVSGIDAEILSLSWSPRDAHILVSGGADSRVLIWDIRKHNSCLLSLDELNQESSKPVKSSSLIKRKKMNYMPSLPDRLACAHSRAQVLSVVFTDYGRSIVSIGSDGSGRIWRESSTFNYYYNTQVSFEKKLGRSWGTLGYHLCYSKTTDLIFAVNAVKDSMIECFDAFSGVKLNSLKAHIRKVRCIAVRENTDPEVYSASDDGFILKWSCKTNGNTHSDYEVEDADEDSWST